MLLFFSFLNLDLGIIPSHVFSLEIPETEIFSRLEKDHKIRRGKKQNSTEETDYDNENDNDNESERNEKNRDLQTKSEKDNPLLPLHNSDDITKLRIEKQIDHQIGLKRFFQETYGNLITLDGTKSKWFLYNHAENLVRKNIYQAMMYYTNIGQGKAASIEFKRLTVDEISSKLSHCEYYCPVSLHKEELFYSDSTFEYKENNIPFFGE